MNTEWPLPSDHDLDRKIRDIAQEKGISFDDAVEEFVDRIVQEYREGCRLREKARAFEAWARSHPYTPPLSDEATGREGMDPDEDAKFRAAVQKGIEAADRGELIDHEEVERMVEGWLKGK